MAPVPPASDWVEGCRAACLHAARHFPHSPEAVLAMATLEAFFRRDFPEALSWMYKANAKKVPVVTD